MKPCWPGYFADPFVLRTSNGYYAYGTDAPERPTFSKTGKQFPILFSTDLTSWDFVDGALEPPKGMKDLAYWAPEVAEKDGRFYMFYSAGGDAGEEHKIRVAIADNPAGPFVGDDRPLIPDEPFTIDAHPCLDRQSNTWQLFFAKDFFDRPTGTGIAVAPLSDDMLSVTGPPQTVFRAQAPWQIFERNRFWYDRTWPEWYCVEGPFVIFREGQYRMFYSGGRWEADHYGVGCGVSDHLLGPYADPQVQEGPGVLRTKQGLRGPGHNSIVVGPDGLDYICFHAWDEHYTARRLHILPLRPNSSLKP